MKKLERRKDTGNIFIRYWKSFRHAVDGIVYAIEYELNILVMMIVTIISLGISFLLNISRLELVVVLLCVGSITACEMINTAIEACVDLVTTKEHPLAKIAKDCASAATLILCVISICIGGIIFIPRIIALFS